jgi:hypothetical protein
MSRGFELTIYDFDDVNPILGESSTFGDYPEHPRPYLLEVTNFTSQEIDFAAGASTIGAVTIAVLDKRRESGDQKTGYVTQFIGEIIGRRARLRRRRGSTWLTVFDGIVHGYDIDEDAVVVYRLHLRDGRDRERAADLFTRNGTFVVYGAGGASGPAEPYGALPGGGHLLDAVAPNLNAFSLASDPDPADGIHYGFFPFDFERPGRITSEGYVVDPITLDEVDMPERVGSFFEYRDLVIRWRASSGSDWNYVRDMPRAFMRSIMDPNQTDNVGAVRPAIYVASYDPSELPPDGGTVQWQVLADKTSPGTPFFWDRGTFGDLLREIYDGEYTRVDPRIRYSPEAMDEFAYETPTARFIADEPATSLREWVQENVYAPIGYAPSFDSDLRIVPLKWALPDNEEELPILTAEKLVPAGNWSHDLESVINAVEVTFIRELQREEDAPPTRERPSLRRRILKWIIGFPYDKPAESSVQLEQWERLAEVEVVRRRINAGSAAILGTREIKYRPVTVRSIGDSFGRPVSGATIDEIGDEIADNLASSILNRFPFGSVHYIADVLATDEEVWNLQVGQWVRARPDWMPDYQSGLRGARRVMQIVAITDERENYRTIHLMDGAADDTEGRPACPRGCILVENAQSIVIGDQVYHIFTEDGWVETLGDPDSEDPYDECVVDVLAIGEGGHGGEKPPLVFPDSKDSLFYATEEGEAVDPDSVNPTLAGALVAKAGGRGGAAGSTSNSNGGPGACGGGAGGGSGDLTGTPGGGGLGTQGFRGGPSFQSTAVLFRYAVLGGSGGSHVRAGERCPRFQKFNLGGEIYELKNDGWPGFAVGQGGESGWGEHTGTPYSVYVEIGGGGGSGGWATRLDQPLKPGRRFKIVTGGISPFGKLNGGGGDGYHRVVDDINRPASPGGMGMVVIREDIEIDEPWAELTGGTVSGGWRYQVYTSSGTVAASAPGKVEALLVGGGGGGGSGAGGGGGAGGVAVREVVVADGTPVAVGTGGSGGAGGAAGQSGGESSVSLVRVLGGGGGGGANSKAGLSGASGGGGAGDDGSPGGFVASIGNSGGQGAGAVGGIDWGGGGGGAGTPGLDGADAAGRGFDLDYRVQVSSGALRTDPDVPEVTTVNGGANFGLGLDFYQSGEAAVQVVGRQVVSTTSYFSIGIKHARTSSLGFANGYYFRPKIWGIHPAGIFRDSGATSGNLATATSAPNQALRYPIQFYVGAGVQEGWSPYGSAQAADTTYDGRTNGEVILFALNGTTTLRLGFSDLMVFRTKNLLIQGAPSGWSARVKNAAGSVVSTGSESGGLIVVDLFQVGASAANEVVPVAGWPTLELLDGSSVVQASITGGGIFPGALLTYTGSALAYDLNADGDPITGLEHYDNFLGVRPLPSVGNGGRGKEAPDFSAFGGSPAGTFGGGGGAGGSIQIVPEPAGGAGGGGAGSTNPAVAGANGVANTGGGGGGSGTTAQPGGNGGSGIVILRVPEP